MRIKILVLGFLLLISPLAYSYKKIPIPTRSSGSLVGSVVKGVAQGIAGEVAVDAAQQLAEIGAKEALDLANKALLDAEAELAADQAELAEAKSNELERCK